MKISEYHLGFIGFGHMAQVICRAIERAKLIPRSQIAFLRRDPEKMRQNEKEFGITATSLENLLHISHIVLIAVRPSHADFVLKEMARLKVEESKMIVSVLAGIKLAFYQKYLGSKNPLLRVMPNIASAVGEGMSVFSYALHPSLEFRSLTNLLFSCMGEIIEVSEPLMDICCGIAGSGPGFVFRLIEAMARAGEKGGLTRAKALKMAAQTFAGAAKLILKGSEPEMLLQQITTPNGTTEAGLKVMTALHIDNYFQSVVEASSKRSKELAEEFY